MTEPKLISADSHVNEPGDLWVERLDNPTTTSVLDGLIFPAYTASKSTNHDQEAEDVSGMSDRRRIVHPSHV